MIRYCPQDSHKFEFVGVVPQQCPCCLAWYRYDPSGICLVGSLSPDYYHNKPKCSSDSFLPTNPLNETKL